MVIKKVLEHRKTLLENTISTGVTGLLP